MQKVMKVKMGLGLDTETWCQNVNSSYSIGIC